MATSMKEVIKGTAGELAYERVKPLIQKAKQNLVKVAEAVGKEYDKLELTEQDVFCKKLGWSKMRVAEFSKISREIFKKEEVMKSGNPDLSLESLKIDHMAEIIRTPDKLLKRAAKAGVFDTPPSHKELRTMRRTGKIPAVQKVTRLIRRTPFQKIRNEMIKAEREINSATQCVQKIVRIMHDENIIDAKGTEARALMVAFEKLCTNMASANPKTSDRAFAILRGEA